MEKYIDWENRAGIGILTLKQPEKHNALNRELLIEMESRIRKCHTDDGVHVLVLRGAGKSFCAGGDLDGHPYFSTSSPVVRTNFIREAQRVTLGLQRLPQPTIAVVHGIAGGAGLDLAMACDIRIASEDARFGVLFTRVGLMSDMGGTYLLPRLVGVAKALELMFTGDVIDAKEAWRIGLVNQVVAADALEEKVLDFAARLAKGPLQSYRLSKWAVYRNLGPGFDAALEQEVLCQSFLASTEDAREGVQAFLEKRKPNFKGY